MTLLTLSLTLNLALSIQQKIYNIFKPAAKPRLVLVGTQVGTEVGTYFQYITKKMNKNNKNGAKFQLISRVPTGTNLLTDLLPQKIKIKQFNGKGWSGWYWLVLLIHII